MGSAAPPERWQDVEDFLLTEATWDLLPASWDGPPEMVRPCLVAFTGEERLLVAWWRPFLKGQYMDPLIELLALVCPLGADRVAVSISGRASSLHDPLPPVIDGLGDLRQRVLHLTFVDDHEGRGHRTELLHPYDLKDGEVRWGHRMEMGRSQAVLTEALEHVVRARWEDPASDGDIARQLRRCLGLGHLLSVAPAVFDRLGVDLSRGPSNRRPPRPRQRAGRRSRARH